MSGSYNNDAGGKEEKGRGISIDRFNGPKGHSKEKGRKDRILREKGKKGGKDQCLPR